MNLIRVQIMLEPRQHKALKKAARRSNKSVSQLLRDITNIYLAEMFPEDDEVLQTLTVIKSIRERQLVNSDTILPDLYENASDATEDEET
jgi:hypothetical protein